MIIELNSGIYAKMIILKTKEMNECTYRIRAKKTTTLDVVALIKIQFCNADRVYFDWGPFFCCYH